MPDLCKAVVETYSVREAIQLVCETRGEIVLPVGKAVSVCLAVTELITNACKYVFKGRDHGKIKLFLDGATDRVLIEVKDDSVGMPEQSEADAARGIGMILINSLTKSLAAEISIATGASGTRFSISLNRRQTCRTPWS
ncbi:MAG: two-component sensor histidine kinase [Hyphomonas sp.]